jgi:hypothetical protein
MFKGKIRTVRKSYETLKLRKARKRNKSSEKDDKFLFKFLVLNYFQ